MTTQATHVRGKDYEVTGVGRLVQGDLDTVSNLDYVTGKPKTNADGSEKKPENFFAVAFPKLIDGRPNPDWEKVRAYLDFVGHRDWPHFFQNGPTKTTFPNFSDKVIDGDGYDGKGVHNATKEGFAGCWVLRFSSQFLPKRFYEGRYNPQDQITEPGAIKRGDHVRVVFSALTNESTQSPGLYVRASSVELFRVGKAIVSTGQAGPEAAAAFGAPPAATYVPVDSQPVHVPAGTSPAAAAFSAPPATPAPQQAAAVPGRQPEPYSGYIPVPEQAPAVPAAPVAPVWPPAGWTQHPSNPAYWYMGTEVITEAELRARQQ